MYTQSRLDLDLGRPRIVYTKLLTAVGSRTAGSLRCYLLELSGAVVPLEKVFRECWDAVTTAKNSEHSTGGPSDA